MKKIQILKKNQNNKADYKKKTKKWWKWVVIGDNPRQYKFFHYQQNNKMSYISVFKCFGF